MLTDSETMMDWIAEITAQGIRRPGYAADDWTEQWAAARFREYGLEDVTLDPIDVKRFEPLSCVLEVWHPETPSDRTTIPCFPAPFTAAGEIEGDLAFATFQGDEDLSGRIAVNRDPLLVLPQTIFTAFATWYHDPTNEVPTHVQTLPFGARLNGALEPALEEGAIGYVGILTMPWETDRYYVPYDAVERMIPAVWLSPGNGARLEEFVAGRPARARLAVASTLAAAISHNVTGALRGASDEWVIIGSHHDGPWASAVEDASGIALVLAQARYWSRVPARERPFNLLFLLNGGHMSGGAGLHHFVDTHADFLADEVVVEIHLEHAAREARGVDGALVPTDKPEWRWWFTSFIPPLEELVADTICRESLERSLIMPPEGFPPGSEHPPTDAAFFHPLAPIVSFLTAPVYLFDEADTIDKVHEPSLEPLTRATVRIVEGLRGQTAAGLHAQTYVPPRAAAIPPCPPRG
ncbi:MAG: M28 family peptidase [Deltaproteobacteria bacterium]|nr:M28 family peptidase [Deltaproteobacteria bacterium]